MNSSIELALLSILLFEFSVVATQMRNKNIKHFVFGNEWKQIRFFFSKKIEWTRLIVHILLIESQLILITIVNVQKIKCMEKMLRKVLGAERSKHLPPIKRGSCADVYLTSSGQDQMVSFFITFSHIFFFFLILYCKRWKNF